MPAESEVTKDVTGPALGLNLALSQGSGRKRGLVGPGGGGPGWGLWGAGVGGSFISGTSGQRRSPGLGPYLAAGLAFLY